MFARQNIITFSKLNRAVHHSLKIHVTVLAIIVSVVSGLILSIHQNHFLNTQVAYLFPTLIALLVIGNYFWHKGFQGLLNPTISVLTGFLLFLSAGPLLNPTSASWNVEFYTSADMYLPVVGLYSIGLCAFLFGVNIASKQRTSIKGPHRLEFRIDLERLWLFFLAVVIIFMFCYVALSLLNGLNLLDFFFTSRYGVSQVGFSHPLSRYFEQIIRYLVISVSVLSGAILALSTQPMRRIVALSTISICILYMLSRGVRFHFLYSIGGAILVWWHLSQKTLRPGKPLRRPWRLWLIGSMTLLFAIQMIAIRNTPGGLRTYLSNGPNLVGIQNFIDYGIDRNIAIQQALETVPSERPFIWGLSFISPFVSYIPRNMWAGKPTMLSGYMEGYTIFANPNTTFSILGELHINFGLLGIVVGMLIAGLLAQRWQNFYLIHGTSTPVTILYAMSLPAFALFVRGDFQAAFNSAFFPGLLVLLILNLSRPSSRYPEPSTS